MANNVVSYNVTGRYMAGSAVTAYHLVGQDGSQTIANKDRVIYMIGKGLIDNMRIQYDLNNKSILIRGKGINLNNLPVFDINNNKFRDNKAPKGVSTGKTAPTKDISKVMGQLRITKRIMYKQNCIGYTVEDMNGTEKKLSRKKILELGCEKLLSNATVNKWKPENSEEYKFILKGINCNLNELPIITVDQNGNIISDTSVESDRIYARAVRMKCGGILYDNDRHTKSVFESGDFIICGANSILRVFKAETIKNKLTTAGPEHIAVCDATIDKVRNYEVELFGNTVKALQPEQVKRWPIVEIRK